MCYFYDENSNNFDDYGDENDQKTDKYHGFSVKKTQYVCPKKGKGGIGVGGGGGHRLFGVSPKSHPFLAETGFPTGTKGTISKFFFFYLSPLFCFSSFQDVHFHSEGKCPSAFLPQAHLSAFFLKLVVRDAFRGHEIYDFIELCTKTKTSS